MSQLALAALALLAALAPWTAAAQASERARGVPDSEGPLDNDAFVPVSEEAARALASGDAALVKARAATGPDASRQLDIAFDAWLQALVEGGPGASTWFDPAPNAERRLSEGLHAGVLRRLLALSSEERARWSARFAAPAESALADLHDGYPPAERASRLADLVRLHPLTAAAARAALELGDLALEAGLTARARAGYARAALEAGLAGEPALQAVAEARAAASAGPPAAGQEAWRRASASDFADSFAWRTGRGTRGEDPRGERWLRPGLAFVDANRLALQTESEILLLGLSEAGQLTEEGRLHLEELLGGYAPDSALDVPHEPPGWPLLPIADELGLVVVAGRTRRDEPNALVALELEDARPHLALGLDLGRPRSAGGIAWAVVGAERLDGSQHGEPIPELEALGNFEFQPGPVTCAERVLVQARTSDGPMRTWLLAFDRRDGALAWMRLLAGGADRVATARFGQPRGSVAGQPLLAFELEDEPRVFVGTHLGLGVLLDGLLGEPLWSFKNRRRGEHASGWNGDRPVLAPRAAGAPRLLWAPMDSDRLYALNPFPAQAGAGEAGAVLAGPPTPLQEARTLLGGDERGLLVLGSAGRERTLSSWPVGQDPIDALDLGRDERFRGLGAVSPERVWVSTNRGLYLFDRTRELYLLDYDTLPPAGADDPGGDLYARGASVLVVGSSAIWSFRAR